MFVHVDLDIQGLDDLKLKELAVQIIKELQWRGRAGEVEWPVRPDPTKQDPARPDLILNVSEMAMAETKRMIQAIKALRERTGCGLKEAKDAVDAYKLAWEQKNVVRW